MASNRGTEISRFVPVIIGMIVVTFLIVPALDYRIGHIVVQSASSIGLDISLPAWLR